MNEWMGFAGVSGGAAAGLTGLMFIVVAFRFDTIAVSQEFRSRAAQTLTLFLTVMTVAILITVPQRTWTLGLEMVAVAFASAIILKGLHSAAMQEQTNRPSMVLIGALAVFVGSLVAAGVVLSAGAEWGMYLYVITAVTGLVMGVNGAWTFLTRAGIQPLGPSPDTSGGSR